MKENINYTIILNKIFTVLVVIAIILGVNLLFTMISLTNGESSNDNSGNSSTSGTQTSSDYDVSDFDTDKIETGDNVKIRIRVEEDGDKVDSATRNNITFKYKGRWYSYDMVYFVMCAAYYES